MTDSSFHRGRKRAPWEHSAQPSYATTLLTMLRVDADSLPHPHIAGEGYPSQSWPHETPNRPDPLSKPPALAPSIELQYPEVNDFERLLDAWDGLAAQ